MGDEYQNRRDIDRLYGEIYNQSDGTLNIVEFEDDSPLKSLPNGYTIDDLFEYYRVNDTVKKDELIDLIYPVGAVYISINNTDPSLLFGGTWVQLEDTFLLGAGETYTGGDTGGEATHTLTTDEIPSHSHGSVYSGDVSGTKRYPWFTGSGDKMDYGSISVGGGQAHNNMPPYLVVYMWKRTE